MFVPFLVVIAALAPVTGSGAKKTEARPVGAFTAIESGGSWNLEVVAGAKPGVEVSGDDNVLPLIETSVKDGILVIRSKESVSPKLPLLVKITMPYLTSIKLGGSGNATIIDVASKKLWLEISGAGNASYQGTADEVVVKSSGAGNVALVGKSKGLTATASGAGNVDASAFEVTTAVVKSSGAGNVAVNSTGNLDVDASGAGRVVYAGSPTVTKKVSGAASVTAKAAPAPVSAAPVKKSSGW